jgi:solute carrier family 9 (sodium/hydrogen exchanger), member 8
VFGESVLNDAVAIVLFHTFLHEYLREETYTAMTLPATLLNFVTISLGSLTVGALIGLSASFVFKHTHISDYPKFEISLLFLFAYGSYAFAEAVNLSVSAAHMRTHYHACV